MYVVMVKVEIGSSAISSIGTNSKQSQKAAIVGTGRIGSIRNLRFTYASLSSCLVVIYTRCPCWLRFFISAYRALMVCSSAGSVVLITSFSSSGSIATLYNCSYLVWGQ